MMDDSSSFGSLGHAMTSTQKLIHKLEKYCHIVQITGTFRHLPLSGIHEILLLSVGKRLKDLTGAFINSTTANELHTMFLNPIKGIHNPSLLCAPKYTFHWEKYKFTVINLLSITQLAIAQLIHTGPPQFAEWLTSRMPSQYPSLPWSYSISKDYHLLNNNKVIKNIKQENHFFEAIGSRFIPPEDRLNGDPAYWHSFKLDATP